MLNFIQVGNGIHLILDGKMRVVSKGEPCYNELLAAVKAGASAETVQGILDKNLRRMTEAIASLAENKITDDVTISGGLVLYRGEPVHNTLADRMIQMLDEGFDLTAMARFLANLMENPSYRAVRDLYSFLEFGKMPITEDGHFLAYKAVRADYTDIHSGTIDNSIGAIVEMPRREVDEDPNRTCSHGLHVCSFEYLPHFAHANGHVMVCKVNPRDVVAIPTDYARTKMRVCRYEVVDECKDYYTSREHVLGNTTVATDEEPFLVIIEGLEPETRRYARRSEAFAAAESALELSSTEKVTVKNGVTGVVLEVLENVDFAGYDNDPDEDYIEDEDADFEEEETTYEIVYADHEDDLDGNNDAPTYRKGITDVSEAKRLALEALDRTIGQVAQVRNEQTGEVILTVQDH
jgi:hypothetical protein